MKKLLIGFLMLLFLAIPMICQAADVTLAWDPPEIATDVVGYKLYWGAASGKYSNSIDVKNVLIYIVTGLPDGTYFFAGTAYNAFGTESIYSNEVSTTIKTTAPSKPRNVRVITITVSNTGGGGAPGTVVKTDTK